MKVQYTFALLIVFCTAMVARADGPQDNLAANVRPVPPPGVEVSAADREALEQGLMQLRQRISALRGAKSPETRELLPDVEIFDRAVHQALTHNEFFSPDEIQAGQELIRVGLERGEQLANGQRPWTTQPGLVVRGYVSRLDRTVQPYGLVIPTSYRGEKTRLDIWLHGRSEKLSEVAFLNQRRKQTGQIAPAHTIVLHPFGRYCNAFKFAGEIDVLESLDAVKRHYHIDEDRVAIRGFSMGGAGCWQMAVHYPDLWFAANPGAGFAETPEFLRTFQQELLAPTSWEKTLWRWYDCTGYAANLFNCSTVAYSGELDSQKQAADIMERALADEQLSLTHIIGPQTKHSIHPAAGVEIERRLAELAVLGREHVPRRVQFATYTLKYNRSHWLTLNGLDQHWEQARATAEMVNDKLIRVETRNVAGFSLVFPAGGCPFDLRHSVAVEVNGQRFEGAKPLTDRSWTFHWWRGTMQPTSESPEMGLHKRHDLQGPIDDAFLDTFIVVRPTGLAFHAAVDKWSRAEMDHLLQEWRRHFRGDAVVKDDTAVTDAEIASAHLILFGDVRSNTVLGRIAGQLPLRWNEQSLTVGGQTLDSADHAPVLIYPNPLHPQRYVVLNSGFTFREYDYLNNARQVPRLPDWAAVDLRSPPDAKYPGKIVAAGFFDESWK